MTLKTGLRSLKMSPFDRAHMTSYWRSIVTMALSHVISEIFNVEKYRDLEIPVNGQSRPLKVVTFDRLFTRKSPNFPTPLYFAPPLKRFLLELGTGAEVRKLEWWDYRNEKEVWRYPQPSGYNAPTWQTDGHRATANTALTHSVAR